VKNLTFHGVYWGGYQFKDARTFRWGWGGKGPQRAARGGKVGQAGVGQAGVGQAQAGWVGYGG